jgi:hypothetical protein
VQGRPEWIFIKLHCHAFFEYDQKAMMGEELERFMQEILDQGQATGRFKIHFASAREVFNMIVAALEGKSGNPGQYRDYSLRPIWREGEILKSHLMGQQLQYANGVK